MAVAREWDVTHGHGVRAKAFGCWEFRHNEKWKGIELGMKAET